MGYDKLDLVYYDSYGNVKRHKDGSVYYNFTYDDQNRVTEAYNVATSGADYGYDGAGRLSNYEGALPGLNSTFPAYMPKYSNYTFNANGNVTARPGQTLVWDVQNRLSQVTGGTTETYLYDPDGQRVKKTVGSTVSLYPFAHYEITGSTVTKYYFFAGMRVAMKQGSTLTYLHSDHLGSTVLETNTSGNQTADQKYRAYGKQRDTGAVVTDHKFTGQKLDGTGLQYYNARYYDPAIGTFISPDTIVPDATNVFDYNRYMMARGNPLKYNDPTGHCSKTAPDTSEQQAYTEWADCWQMANTILAQWDTTSTYWNNRYTSKDVFREYIAPTPSLDSAYFSSEIIRWVTSDDYAAWNAQLNQSIENNRIPTVTLDPVDAVGVGFSISGDIPILGAAALNGGGGVEVLAHRDGSVAMYRFAGGGVSVGGGATVNLYVVRVRNMEQPKDYAGGSTSADLTASLVVGVVGGTFSGADGGAYGEKYGFAPGAKFSYSVGLSNYSDPIILIGPSR